MNLPVWYILTLFSYTLQLKAKDRSQNIPHATLDSFQLILYP